MLPHNHTADISQDATFLLLSANVVTHIPQTSSNASVAAPRHRASRPGARRPIRRPCDDDAESGQSAESDEHSDNDGPCESSDDESCDIDALHAMRRQNRRDRRRQREIASGQSQYQQDTRNMHNNFMSKLGDMERAVAMSNAPPPSLASCIFRCGNPPTHRCLQCGPSAWFCKMCCECFHARAGSVHSFEWYDSSQQRWTKRSTEQPSLLVRPFRCSCLDSKRGIHTCVAITQFGELHNAIARHVWMCDSHSVIFMSGHRFPVSFEVCECMPAAVSLAYHGFMSCTPVDPGYAIQFSWLDLYIEVCNCHFDIPLIVVCRIRHYVSFILFCASSSSFQQPGLFHTPL